MHAASNVRDFRGVAKIITRRCLDRREGSCSEFMSHSSEPAGYSQVIDPEVASDATAGRYDRCD